MRCDCKNRTLRNSVISVQLSVIIIPFVYPQNVRQVFFRKSKKNVNSEDGTKLFRDEVRVGRKGPRVAVLKVESLLQCLPKNADS